MRRLGLTESAPGNSPLTSPYHAQIVNSYAVNQSTRSHSVVGMSELNAQIGQLLKDLREERGWSLRELGLVVGMNKTYPGDIELGKRNPSINSLEKIVAGYGLTVKEFFAKMPD